MDFSKVMVDDFHGAFSVVEHLLEQGCRHIAHFRGPQLASTSINRYEGYLAALKKYDLPVNEALILECEELTLEEGQAFTNRILNSGQPVDGIFAVTDAVALGTLVALREAGKKVPQEIAVAGFSDWKISAILDPPLTSVAQPSEEMGTLAAKLLLKEIAGMKDDEEVSPETIILRTELKIRKSSMKKTFL